MIRNRSTSMLAGILLLTGLVIRSAAQTPQIANVSFESLDSVIVIRHDIILSGVSDRATEGVSLNGTYRIDLLLKRDSDPDFFYRPVNVIGLSRQYTATALQRKLVWNFLSEVPQGIEDGDFFFELRLVPLKDPSSASYLWYGTGALLAATGIVTYYVISQQTPNEDLPGSFPLPPGRPK